MLRKVIHSVLFLSLNYFPVFGFENPEVTIIPFEIVGKLIVVKAAVDGRQGNFVLDTGVSDLVLNKKYFKGIQTDRIFYGINGKASLVEMKEVQLALGDFEKNKVYAELTDLNRLEQHSGIPLQGMIGNRVFKGCELVIDYIFQELTIYQLDKKGNRKGQHLLHLTPADTLQFKWKGGIPYVSVEVDGQTLKLGLDTGAEVNLLDTKSRRKIAYQMTDIQQKNLGSFGNTVKTVTSSTINGIQIGSLECQPMKTVFSSIAQLNKALDGAKLDGIAGYEMLHQFRTAINFKKREIYLWDTATVEQQWLVQNEQTKKPPIGLF